MKEKNVKKLLGNYGSSLIPCIGLFLLIIVFSLTTQGKFLSVRNFKNLIGQCMVTMVTASGTIFVMAHGNMDFSLGGGAALVATLTYLVTGGKNTVLVLVVCIFLGIGCGLFTAIIHVVGKVPCFLAGMAMMFIGRGVCQGIAATRPMSLSVAVLEHASNSFYFTCVIIVFALAVLIYNFTRIGKNERYIGANQNTAELTGISIDLYKTLAFIISGITLGVATFLLMLRGSGVSITLGTNLESDTMIALILGGVPLTGGANAKISAVPVGVLTYYVLNNGLTIWGLDASIIDLIKGIIFIIVVFVSMDRKSIKFVP